MPVGHPPAGQTPICAYLVGISCIIDVLLKSQEILRRFLAGGYLSHFMAAVLIMAGCCCILFSLRSLRCLGLER